MIKKGKTTKIKKSKFRAVIYNGNTEPYIMPIDTSKTTFRRKGKQYNFKTQNVMYFKVKGWFSTKYYLFYSLDNPDPLHIKEEHVKPNCLSATEYDTILETKIIEKANEHSRGNVFEDLFTMKNLVIAGVVVFAIIYFMGA